MLSLERQVELSVVLKGIVCDLAMMNRIKFILSFYLRYINTKQYRHGMKKFSAPNKVLLAILATFGILFSILMFPLFLQERS